MRRIDYARLRYDYVQHHARFMRHVEAQGLPCQACGGSGKIGYDSIYDGPADPCGWCEATGKTTRWLRGLWLRCCRDEQRARRERKAA